MTRIYDLKKKGILQDIKELKSDKGFNKKLRREISRIKSERVKREKKYKEKLEEAKERTKRTYKSVKEAVATKRNTQKQLQERINKIEKERSEIIKKRIASFEKGTYFPQASYNQQLTKLKEEKEKKERLLGGINSAQKNLRQQQRKEAIQKIKTKALLFGSKVEGGINVALEKGTQKAGQLAKQRVIFRKILKPSKTSYKMPDRPVASVWGDENRFFKGAIQNDVF